MDASGHEKQHGKPERWAETTLFDLLTSQGRIEASLHALRSDMADLAMKLESFRSDLIKWFVGTALVVGALAFTAAKYTN